MGGCDRAYLKAYIDEFCWRRNCIVEDLNKDSSQIILKRFLYALNSNFPVDGGLEVDFTDRYSNFYDFVLFDNNW